MKRGNGDFKRIFCGILSIRTALPLHYTDKSFRNKKVETVLWYIFLTLVFSFDQNFDRNKSFVLHAFN